MAYFETFIFQKSISPLWTNSGGLLGTNDWTHVSYEFNTGSNTQITVAARLGTYSGTTTGKAWFDDLKLELLSNPQCYTLTTNNIPGGAIATYPAPNCNNGTQFIHGTVVKLIASPANGYTFSNWSGEISGTTNPIYVTMTSNKSITANFVIGQLQTFGDVPSSHSYYSDIEVLYANGYTGGCSTSPLLFCPDISMSRAQSAVFMLRGNFGSGYVPVSASHFFADNWKNSSWGEGWAESMYLEGLTGGCSTSPLKFCPDEVLTNVQLAVFGLRLKYGMAYTPPSAQGTVFADMTDVGFWGAGWAEQAYADGLIPACGTDAGSGLPKFCPNALVSRGFGASVIVNAKNLTMP